MYNYIFDVFYIAGDALTHLGKCGDAMLPRQRHGWTRAYCMCSLLAASDQPCDIQADWLRGRTQAMQCNAMVASWLNHWKLPAREGRKRRDWIIGCVVTRVLNIFSGERQVLNPMHYWPFGPAFSSPFSCQLCCGPLHHLYAAWARVRRYVLDTLR
jgi:hypothetical protein